MKKTIDRIIRFPKLLVRSNFHYFCLKKAASPYWIRANSRVCRIAADTDAGIKQDYREIIIEDRYEIFKYAKKNNPHVIVDIGANVGFFSRLCSLLFSEAHIYSYEPHPRAFNWLTQNCKSTNIKIFPCAVWRNSGYLMLNTNCESTIGAMIDENGDLKVRCISVAEVAEGENIDLLKMDCEGSEWNILEDGALLNRTKDFFLEYHLMDGKDVDNLKEMIEKGNHKIMRILPRVEHFTHFGFLWSKHV